MLTHRNTLTFFQLGARVHLECEARCGDVYGELVAKGRRYLVVRIDDGAVIRKLQPSWVRWAPPKTLVAAEEM